MRKRANDRRRRKSDEAIRKAFSALLTEKPLAEITVTELAARADIDRKTFYLRYTSLDAFVDCLLKEEMIRVSKVLANATADADGKIDIPSLFAALGGELVSTFNQRAALMRHVNTDTLIARLRTAMADVFTERDALGLAEDLGPYFDLFVSFFCSGILSLYHQWADSDSELPMEELATLAGSAVAGGIAALTKTARALGVSDR